MVETGTSRESEAPAGTPTPFMAVKVGQKTWVVELSAERSVAGSDPAAHLVLAQSGAAAQHFAIDRRGDSLRVAALDDESPTYLNGKKVTEVSELKPGDELSAGTAQLVLGLSPASTRTGRRALTHHEFCERLYEEVARAARKGRHTALVMVQAKPGEGRAVAQAALDSFRAGDLVGTYGHDEIEFLLSDTSAELATGIVSRVLADSRVSMPAVGVAVAPEDGEHPERLLRSVRYAVAASKASGQIEVPRKRPTSTAADLPEMLDPASQQVVQRLTQLAEDNGSVLLTGEPSSGKSVFARVLHRQRSSVEMPFQTVVCGGTSDAALAKRLGEVKGGAHHPDGGTLLLDEIGDLTSGQQEVLLEFVKEVQGWRLVATTHRVLRGIVDRGAFNKELFEALSDHEVELPPLRNRPDDVLPLAERFAMEAGARTPIPFSAGAVARLRSYPWPGNVLELRNAMERAVRLSQGGEILAEHLPSQVLPQAGSEGKLREHVDSVERDAIVKALADTNHNQTHAAKRLGVSRRALIYKMEKYGLKAPPGRLRRL